MKIIGLTGGIGSGKSEVARILSENMGYIIDADKINHEIMLKGNLAYNEITAHFGDAVLKPDGEIDRKKLAEIVFVDKAKLDALTAINHKYVIQETYKRIELVKACPSGYRFIVIDAPLLIEAGIHKDCDLVCVVESDLDLRISRIMKRDKTTKQHAHDRIKSQMPYAEMKTYADYIITNNKGIEELACEVMGLLGRL